MEIFGIVMCIIFFGIPALVFLYDKTQNRQYKIDSEVKNKLDAEKKSLRAEENIEIAKYRELNAKLADAIKNTIDDYPRAKLELKNLATQEIRDKFFLPAKRLLDKEFDLGEMYLSVATGRLNEAFKSDSSLASFDIHARVKNKEGLRYGEHFVSLNQCDCESFKSTGKPCKHILFLAYTFGVLQTNQENCKNYKDDLLEEVIKLSARKKSLQETVEALSSSVKKGEEYNRVVARRSTMLEKKVNELQAIKPTVQEEVKLYKERAISEAKKSANIIKEAIIEDAEKEADKTIQSAIVTANSYKDALISDSIRHIEKIAKEKIASIPYAAEIISDALTIPYIKSAYFLKSKSNPAYKEAYRIGELQKKTKEIIKKQKEAEYKLAYIEAMFPNINDIFEPGFNENEDFELENQETTDRVRLFLSPEEYASLSTTEKNQLALDRYVESRKSKWQVGRDYEMFIGHKLECEGYHVQYTGMIEKLEDMGRDLIAVKCDETLIVQCKNWSQEKTIHEKHIFQLYGTVVLWKLDNPMFNVRGVFITTTMLSDKAKDVARELGIEVRENIAVGDFPRIKCNVNNTTGEKIYHLPFDQQYDSAVIEEKRGECYALTVEEAEDKGFRRAWRHFTSR